MKKIASLVRSHLGAAIAGTTTAVVLVGGLLFLALVGSGGSSPAGASVPAATSTTVAPGGGARPGASVPAGKRHGVRGQITAIEGTTWTVKSARGGAVTVEVTPETAFGTKTAPLTASDFAVGDQIVVAGARTTSTVTATRIAKAPAGAGA